MLLHIPHLPDLRDPQRLNPQRVQQLVLPEGPFDPRPAVCQRRSENKLGTNRAETPSVCSSPGNWGWELPPRRAHPSRRSQATLRDFSPGALPARHAAWGSGVGQSHVGREGNPAVFGAEGKGGDSAGEGRCPPVISTPSAELVPIALVIARRVPGKRDWTAPRPKSSANEWGLRWKFPPWITGKETVVE